MRQGLYIVCAVPPGHLQQAALACTATGGVASLTTAGRLWDFRGVPADPLTHVTVAYGRSACADGLDGVRIHRSRSLAPTDTVRRDDGISLTSPPRTLFDLAAVTTADALESMIEQAIDRSMFTVPTLWGVARRLARSGRAGSSAFVDVLASRPAWRRPVGSGDELVLEHALVAAGLPRPERQWPVTLPSGRTVHLDLAWPTIRLAFEVDHVTWHGGRLESTRDKWRDRQIRLLGWEVDRVTDADIRDRRAATVRDLATLHRHRAAAVP